MFSNNNDPEKQTESFLDEMRAELQDEMLEHQMSKENLTREKRDLPPLPFREKKTPEQIEADKEKKRQFIAKYLSGNNLEETLEMNLKKLLNKGKKDNE